MIRRFCSLLAACFLLSSPLKANVNVEVEQVGAPRYFGSKLVVGIAVTNSGEEPARVMLAVWDDFPEDYQSGGGSGRDGASPRKVNILNGELMPGSTEVFRYYPMGETGGWKRRPPIPNQPLGYSLFYELVVGNEKLTSSVRFSIEVPQTDQGLEILEGFWDGSLCDKPTISHCTATSGSKLGSEFWEGRLGNRSEFAFDLAFPWFLTADASALTENLLRSDDRKSKSAPDLLGEFNYRSSRCLHLSEDQESLRCLYGVILNGSASDVTPEVLKSDLSRCGNSSEYVNSLKEILYRDYAQ